MQTVRLIKYHKMAKILLFIKFYCRIHQVYLLFIFNIILTVILIIKILIKIYLSLFTGQVRKSTCGSQAQIAMYNEKR